MWTRIKNFIGDTIAFTYIKSLIAGESNKDLRELMATMLTFAAIVVLWYSCYVAKSDDARLYLYITTCSFIAALFGMEKFGATPTVPAKEEPPKEID